jgi:hypothetical protein
MVPSTDLRLLTELPLGLQVQDGKLSYRGNTTFFADKAPKGRTQRVVLSCFWYGY